MAGDIIGNKDIKRNNTTEPTAQHKLQNSYLNLCIPNNGSPNIYTSYKVFFLCPNFKTTEFTRWKPKYQQISIILYLSNYENRRAKKKRSTGNYEEFDEQTSRKPKKNKRKIKQTDRERKQADEPDIEIWIWQEERDA